MPVGAHAAGPRIAVFPKGFMEALSDGSMELAEWIAMAGTLGADGLELYPTFLRSTEAGYLRKVKERADREGLPVPMMCSSPDFTHPDPQFRREEVRRMREWIDAMTALGPASFRSCRVLSGQNRPGLAREDGIAWTVECIRELLPYAAERRVHLVIENHYKDGFWTHPEFAQASDRFLDIVGRIDSPWFGVNYDPSNAIMAGEDPIALLETVKRRVVTMHASDRYVKEGYSLDDIRGASGVGYSEALAHGVIGKGMNDYGRIFGILSTVGFRGWISVEDGVNGLDELRESVDFLRAKIGEYWPDR